MRLAISRMTWPHSYNISLAHDPQWNAFAGAPRIWERGAAGADNFGDGPGGEVGRGWR